MGCTASKMPSSTKPILVIGSTGNVGNATINSLALKGVKTRAGVRDVSSEKAVALKALAGVEIVNADLSKPASLSKHMVGVSAVYIVSPGAENRVELVAAGIAAAKAANVPHVVVVSVPSIEADGDLCFKGHFSQIEESAKASGLPFTLLRLPMFFENQWANQGSIKGQGKIYGPADPSKPVTLVGVSDIAAASAAVLVDPESHVNKTYTLASDTTTFGKIAAGFASATGNDCDYVQVPYPAALEAMVGLGFPEWQAKGVCELLRLVDSESPAAVNDTGDLTKLLGGPPTTFEKWVASVAGGFK